MKVVVFMSNTTELVVFIIYLVCMIGIGVFFFLRSRNGGEKEYFLGGRKMGPGFQPYLPALPI